MKDSVLKLKAEGVFTGELKATLAEVSIEASTDPNDFDSYLKYLDDEINKWKDALQGEKDFEADSTWAVKSSRELSPFIDWSHPIRRTRL